MKVGYYWVRFVDRDGDKTIGYYDGTVSFPWEVIGSDEIFCNEELEVLAPVAPYR